MGLLWAILMRSVVKDPLRTLVNKPIVCKGAHITPREHLDTLYTSVFLASINVALRRFLNKPIMVVTLNCGPYVG